MADEPKYVVCDAEMMWKDLRESLQTELYQDYAEGIEVVPKTGLEVDHKTPHTYSAYDVGYHSDHGEVKSSRILCGLRRRNFWLVFSFLLVVIVLVVALPVTLTNKKSNNEKVDKSAASASPSSTSTSTVASRASASSVSTAALPTATIAGKDSEQILRTCPWVNGTEYTAWNGQKFQRLCSYLFTYETVKELGTTFNETSSLEECLDKCAAWNTLHKGGAVLCATVAWRYDPNIDYWSYCWGGSRSPDPTTETPGLNTTEHPEHAPADSAWLMS